MANGACWGGLQAAIWSLCAVGSLAADAPKGVQRVPAAAWEDFRVENKVFAADQDEPVSASSTIFHAGVVYDYLEDPAEVTILDMAHGRFLLLDRVRRIKTEVPIEKVAALSDRLKAWSLKQSDPFLQFLADPKLRRALDETPGNLEFSSPWITYRVTAVDAPSGAVASQYREFSDWYCRLNTMLNPGARPPFARIIVSAALESRGQLPREVVLTIRPKPGLLAKEITMRSEHLLVHRLLESDRQRVAEVGQCIGSFKPVGFEQYQRGIAD